MMQKHELETRIAQLESELSAARGAIADVGAYLQSPKFWGENDHVNVTDVMLRLRDVIDAMDAVDAEPWGLSLPVNREAAWRREECRPHFVGVRDDGSIAYRPRYLEGYDLRG